MSAFADPPQAAAYLAGMIDGEGSVFWKGADRQLTIGNTNRDLLLACMSCCETLGITTKLYALGPRPKPHWKDLHVLTIRGRANFKRLIELVPIQSVAKLEKIIAMTATFEPVRVRPTPEELRRLYVDVKQSTGMLARHFDVSAKSIQNWLNDYGIPRRTITQAARIRRTREMQERERDLAHNGHL